MVETHNIQSLPELSEINKSADAQRGIRWTYRDVLRGKSAFILFIDGAFLFVLSIVASLLANSDDSATGGFLGFLKDLLTLKAETFARSLCEYIVLLIPMLLALWLIVALILMAYYNVRDRKVLRTESALHYHAIETSQGWSLPWSVMVGVFDFTAALSLFIGIRTLLDNTFNIESKDAVTIVFTIACLVFAERRIRKVSRTYAARKTGNHLAVCGVLDGLLDEYIPESMRKDLGRAKIATVISLGICRSPEMAALLVAGIDLRTKVKLFSGFLNSAIHGVLCALSFGIAATLANELGDVGGQFASGRGDELVARLREPKTEKPRYLVEILAVLICILYTTVDVALYVLSLV